MEILQPVREGTLAAVRVARLTDRTVRGIGPETLVVGAAVVVAGEAEEAREGENQQGREENHVGEPARPRAEPGMLRRAPDLGGVEGGEVGAELVTPVLHRRPGPVDEEGAERKKDRQRREPPKVLSERFAKASLGG